MTCPERVAVLLDGEFVRKILEKRLKHFPSSSDVMLEVRRILEDPALRHLQLYRVFYYTADPLTGMATNPFSRELVRFDKTRAFSAHRRLLGTLELERDVAVRRGETVYQGWGIGSAALRALLTGKKQIVEARDVQPRIQQKGVDVRIGLDIASLALKRLVSTIVVVTADSDFVPALKFARREGLRVVLDVLGTPVVRPELKTHADYVLSGVPTDLVEPDENDEWAFADC